MKNLLCAHIFHKTLNLVISLCYLAKDNKETYVSKFIAHLWGDYMFFSLVNDDRLTNWRDENITVLCQSFGQFFILLKKCLIHVVA